MRNATPFPPEAIPSPVTEMFDRLRKFRGWFNIDDCAHFKLLLASQDLYGIRADLLEIGSYHGRSTALMAACLKGAERIVVCDAFRHDTADQYAAKPSVDQFVDNVVQANPGFDRDRLVIHDCLSTDLSLPNNALFRFVHIDGGHQKEVVLGDLELSSRHLVSGGIIAVDDYMHLDWPEVTEGVNQFLEMHADFYVLADLNRHGAKGRKIYLARSLQRERC